MEHAPSTPNTDEPIVIPESPENIGINETSSEAVPQLSRFELKKLEQRARVVANLRELAEKNEEQEVKLFPRQLETLTKIADFIDAGYSVGYVKLPTGVGKTVIFAKLVEAFSKAEESSDLDKDENVSSEELNVSKTIICGPTKIVAGQNTETVEWVGNKEVAKHFGKHEKLDGSIISTTYASFRRRHSDGVIDKDDFGLVILDEAHRSLGDKTRAIVEEYKEGGALVIGFTASPDFHDEKKVVDLLPYEIDRLNVRDAIEGGLLAHLKVFLIKTQTDLSDVKIVGEEYDARELAIKVNSERRNQLIAESTKDLILNEKRKALTYCVDRQHARDMAEAFTKQGVSAEYVGGDTSDNDLKEIFKRFNNGDTKMLCNADLLVEGFNDVELDLVINAKPTLSKVDAEQRGGRPLRLDPKNPNKVAIVIDTIEESQKFAPILYSDIVKAAEVKGINIDFDLKDDGQERVKTDPSNSVLIEDPELVMELTNSRKLKYENLYDIVPVGYLSVEELSEILGVNFGEVRSFVRFRQTSARGTETTFIKKDGDLDHFAEPSVVLEAIRHFKPEYSEFTTYTEISEDNNLPQRDALRLLSRVSEDLDTPPTVLGNVLLFPKSVKRKLIELINQEKHIDILNQIHNEYGEEKRPSPFDMYDPSMDQSDILDPSQELDKRELDAFITGDLGEFLDEREKIAIDQYYFKGKTYYEAGKTFGVTTERIRQIIIIACKKIKKRYLNLFSNMPFKTGSKTRPIIIHPPETPETLSNQSLFSPENVRLTEICDSAIHNVRDILSSAKLEAEYKAAKTSLEDFKRKTAGIGLNYNELQSWISNHFGSGANKVTLEVRAERMEEVLSFAKKYSIDQTYRDPRQFSVTEKLKFLQDARRLPVYRAEDL